MNRDRDDALLDAVVQRIRRETIPPLPPALRRTDSQPTRPAASSTPHAASAAVRALAVCAAILAACGLAYVSSRQDPEQRGRGESRSEAGWDFVRVERETVASAFDEFAAKVDDLERRLDDLEHQVTRRDLRREARTLLADYQPQFVQ